MLNNGGIPIHEPGLRRGACSATSPRAACSSPPTSTAAVAHGTLQFIAVGTPPDEDGSADLQYVLAAARNIGRRMTDYKVVIDKSTVPVGTADKGSGGDRRRNSTRAASSCRSPWSRIPSS